MAIEANLVKVREVLGRAEKAREARRTSGGADELNRWQSLVEKLGSAVGILADALKPERDYRPLCLGLTAERREAFMPALQTFYDALPRTKALASVVEISKEAASIPKPLPARLLWSMQMRREFERENPDAPKLTSLDAVAPNATQTEKEARKVWLDGDHAPDRFVDPRARSGR